MKTELYSKLNVAILDDHYAVREGYKTLLQSFSFINQIFLFATGPALLEFLGKPGTCIHLILLDVKLPGESGVDLCRRIKWLYKDIHVLLMSYTNRKEVIIQSEQCGSDGFLSKEEPPEHVEQAIKAIIFDGRKYFSVYAKAIIFDHEHRNEGLEQSLTSREIQILQMLCKGKTNKQIARELNREETTIEKHRQNIMRKTNTHKMMDLMKYAIQHGLYSFK